MKPRHGGAEEPQALGFLRAGGRGGQGTGHRGPGAWKGAHMGGSYFEGPYMRDPIVLESTLGPILGYIWVVHGCFCELGILLTRVIGLL